MANTILTADTIARAAVHILNNNLIMAKKVFRGYEDSFSQEVDGYEKGDSISIRRPVDFTVRDGVVMSPQDAVEGKFTLSVDKQKGVDFGFTSKQLTMDIKDISQRILQPAMIQLANQIDLDLMNLYQDVSSWVGTPGQVINSNQDFIKGPERMDEYSNPEDMRCAVLAPTDHWGLVGAQTTLLENTLVKEAYQRGELKTIAGLQTFKAQNIPTHTVGAHAGTPLTNGATQGTTYAASKDTDQQTLITDGWTSGAVTLNKGDVFTIADVYAVNSVTKQTLPFLKQFTVVTTISDTAGAITLTMTPAAIPSGAHQTISADIGDGKAISVLGTASIGYRQNLMFCQNAFALVSVPLIAPPGAVDVGRRTHNGLSVRVIPVYDGANDKSNYRLDVLYGVKTIDQRLAHRVSGTA
jgi:hypothetical protein